MKARWAIGLMVVALSLVFVVPVGASPPPPEGGRRPLRGQRVAGSVVDVEDSSLVVEGPRGSFSLFVAPSTRLVIPGNESPSLEDVEVGNYVVAQGIRRGRGFQARIVLVLSSKPHHVKGEVATVSEASFTLLIDEGEVTILVDEQTRFRIPGIPEASLEDVEVGTTLDVVGQHTSEDEVLARLVVARPPRVIKGGGTVIGVGMEALTIERRAGDEVTLLIDEATAFLVPGVVEASLQDIEEGDRVQVRARLGGDTPVALNVTVIPPNAAALVGKVVSISGSTLEVQTRLDQIIEVETDEATKVFVPGIEDATLDDVRVEDRVKLGGEWLDETHFHTWAIQVDSRDRFRQMQGRILSLDENTLTLGSPHGTVDVLVDEETRYLFPDAPEFSFEDLEAGLWVRVRGFLQEMGSLLARQIRGRR